MEEEEIESAGVVIYHISKNKVTYLILKHVKTGKHWGFPKGRREKGETELENAKREIEEEIGIKNIICDDNFKEVIKYSFSREDILYKKKVNYFIARLTEKHIKLSDEHTEFFWGKFEEILEKFGKSSDKEVLIKAHTYLKIKDNTTK